MILNKSFRHFVDDPVKLYIILFNANDLHPGMKFQIVCLVYGMSIIAGYIKPNPLLYM